MFRILCFHSLCRRAWTGYEIQQRHCYIAPPAHTSLLPLLTLHCSPCSHYLLRQPQPEGLSHHCLMQPSDSQYLHKSCSLSPLALYHQTKTNTSVSLAQWPLKQVHAPSLSSTSRTTALWGNLSPL